MDGYKDEENEEKAKEVRRLVTKANKAEEKNNAYKHDKLISEAVDLSLHLVWYLLAQYPSKFIIDIIKIDDNIEEEILTFLEKEIDPINNLHQIFLLYKYDEDIWPNFDVDYTVFVDEDGIHLYKMHNLYLTLPPEFYSFLQRMGILLDDAKILYDLENLRGMTLPAEFGEREGSWPLVVEKGKKL